MYKKLIISGLLLILSIPLLAQLEVKEGSFKKVEGFVNINTEKMYDDNDKPYAVLKIRTENINNKQRRELEFSGDAATFFETEYKEGEVWLYISYYATFIKISHPDLSSTEYWFPYDMEPKKGYEMILVNKKSNIDEQAIINLIDQRLENTSTQNTEVKPAKTSTFFITLNGAYSNYGDLSYGLTLGSYVKMGWFTSVMTSFNFKGFSSDYECGNDFMVGEYYPDYSGNEYFTALSVMAGFIYKVSNPIALRIGAGYGVRNTVYETTDNEIVKNTYISASGIDISLGAQYKVRKFVVSLDAVTTNFKIFEVKLGIGLGF